MKPMYAQNFSKNLKLTEPLSSQELKYLSRDTEPVIKELRLTRQH